MKIVHIITCLLRGGSEENTLATCRLQARAGHDVTLVFGHAADPDVTSLIPPDVRCVQEGALRREIAPLDDIRAVRNMTRLLRRLAPNVVHTHASKAGILGRLAARRAAVPLIIHGVHILPFLNVGFVTGWLYRGLERAVAPFTDAYVNVSEGMRHANLAAGLGTLENNYVVHSGMDLERFFNAKPLEDAPRGRLIALVASLEARKRHSEFLDVFAQLLRTHPSLQLCCLGCGEMHGELVAKAERLGLGESVHFLGFRDDVESWLAAADVCVLPSMREGLPRAVVQYVAAARPVVVTWLPGIEEIVQDGENGFVVKSGQVKDMAEPIDRILSHPSLARSMSSASRQLDLSSWSVHAMVGSIEKIVAETAHRRGFKWLDDRELEMPLESAI